MDKNGLKKWLRENSTPEEIAELDALEEKEKQNTKLSNIEKAVTDTSAITTALAKVQKAIESAPKENNRLIKAWSDIGQALTVRLDDLKALSTKQDPELLTVPLYKSMINAISGVNQSIIDKPTPVWRWPQYASVSVRNKNFSNINPAVDGFNIGSYDDIQLAYTGSNLTTVTYYANGVVTAVLTLTYSGSNLTRAQRTQ